MIDYRENAIWKVYVHIVPRRISGYNHDKYYVGITKKSFVEQRWGKDGYNYKSNKHFYNAIQKYGWDNIEHEVFCEHLTKEEANKIEISLIEKLNSHNPRFGYNKTSGGDGVRAFHMSKKERMIRSEKYSGEKNPYYGKRHSDDTKTKMSEHHYDVSGGNNPRAKKIYQFDLWGDFIAEYPSGRDAARALHITDGMVSAAIHKEPYGGFLWVQEDNVEVKDGLITMKEIPLVNRGTNGIYQFDLDGNFIKRYNGYKEAAECNSGIGVYGIARAAKGEIKQYKNYIWKYYDGVRKSKDIPNSFYIV